ncbi:ketosteroid isomerase-like protein [Streptomyces sp. V4I23]|uniref:nuclear transport factor 2 family protein n=1 Tax=Streptomyces sp. V4I23 TaxID=3042282 RepID=UPI00277E71FE|nr:nuclear transport factor 2 family protein [Streptomyces sp. V4I23]MDQ1005774.1 ketosteroid isomerase-like protein [Streptomyces sp. V4I23]
MTEEEMNLVAVDRWIGLFNSDSHRMIDECYADDFRVRYIGVGEITDKELYHAVEHQSQAAMPDITARVVRVVAAGDTVVVEGVMSGTDQESNEQVRVEFCSWLTFENGLITLEHSYFDAQSGPGMSDLITAALELLGRSDIN